MDITVNGNMNITVNGKVLEHGVGDRYWYIGFGEGGWTPTVCESSDKVEKIVITENGVDYYASDNFKLSDRSMKAHCLFWTKKEAEKWFAENIPETLAFKPDEELFYVLRKFDEYIILIVRISHIDGLCTSNGKLVYCGNQVTEKYGEPYSFTAEDLGIKLFRTYEEADKKRKELA